MERKHATSESHQAELRHVALNASEGGHESVVALCFALPVPTGAADQLPKTITLIPAPDATGLIRGTDGRIWRMSNPDRVVQAFNRVQAITENHAGKLAAPQGGSAPAFGWIEAIRVQDRAIVGDITWTPRGQLALAGREYRYFSPEFLWEKNTGEIQTIVGGSVLNDPNLTQLAALNAAEHTTEQPMNLAAIARALGLAEGADEAAIIAAIKALIDGKQTALNAAQHPDPSKFTPIETHQLALNRAQTAEAELQKFKGDQLEAQIVAAVDEAQAAGKVAPANRDFYMAMCRMEGGLAQFREFAKSAPVVVADANLRGKPEQKAGTEGLTEVQLAICANTGIDPKHYAEQLKADKA